MLHKPRTDRATGWLGSKFWGSRGRHGSPPRRAGKRQRARFKQRQHPVESEKSRNSTNSKNRAGRAGSAGLFGLGSAGRYRQYRDHCTLRAYRNRAKQESAKTEHKQARYVEIYLFFSSRQSVSQLIWLAVLVNSRTDSHRYANFGTY